MRVYYHFDGVDLALVKADQWDAIRHDKEVLETAATLGEIREAGLTELRSWVETGMEDEEPDLVNPDPLLAEQWTASGYEAWLGAFADDHPWDAERFHEVWNECGLYPGAAEWFGEWVPFDLGEYGEVSGASPGGHIDTFKPASISRFLQALRDEGFELVERPDIREWW